VSYSLNPQTIRAAAPTAANDNTQGFVVGSVWVDSSPATDQAYICTSAATGAATWVAAGGVTSHPALTTLGWSSSGHTGTTNSVACFDSVSGAAQTVQATADGSVLTYTGGILTFAVYAMTVAYLSSRTYEINYYPAFTDAAPDASVQAGTMV
jgi:hypothetical protein